MTENKIIIPEGLKDDGISATLQPLISASNIRSSCQTGQYCDGECEAICEWLCEGICVDACQECQSTACQSGEGPDTVTCYKQIYFNNIYQSTQTESGLVPGYSYTPGHSSHLPNVPSYYQLAQIEYNGQPVAGSIICPSNDFTVYYYYIGVQPTSNVYIYATKNNETKWWPATPYIYTSSGWQQATTYIYDGSQWK